ncbi:MULTISPECIES: hypothetical protein [Pseudomonas]|uniref:hypothetical protein n=1 Tax=Pseudomonas TaxID=286 RepID=UPI001BE63D62|nr:MULTISPECIES: hypothetical protein [Pseudomonas]MBT2341825.1 hypothetical protein [Pseudomonas fluorescens]MCD4530497.1 hypothetical protein [Pseudomonas sp. C3-2018]
MFLWIKQVWTIMAGWQSEGNNMNLSRILFIGFMVISGCADTPSSMQEDMPKGVIRFSEKPEGGGDACSLPTDVHTYYNMQYHGCKNDQMTYIQLDNVPSATEIRFDSEKCDTSTDRWYFRIKTIVHPTTTRWIDLHEFASAAVGSVVVRGVVLLEKKTDTSEPIKGKLSCVRTRPSGLP